MPSHELSSSVVACAEHIAFLYQLDTVPSPPSKNTLSSVVRPHDNYALPLDLESQLSDTLAFLAGVKNDGLHIPGIAVLERNHSSKLEVLLAVNKERHGDGEAVLENTKSRLEELFNVLARVSDHVSQRSTSQAVTKATLNCESLVFTKIVTMCADRILCRLRLAPNRYKKPKQPLTGVLIDAINSMEQLKANKDLADIVLIDLFVINARTVIKRIETWQKHHSLLKLEAIVHAVYKLGQMKELPTLLNMITNKMMGPSSRKNLSNIISKVARYQEAARFLYRKAKKHHLVRNMSVVFAKLPQEAFDRTSTPHCPQSLASVIPRYTQSRKPQRIASIYQLLGDNVDRANEQFSKQAIKILKEAKIHAEIQIFVYCQLNAIQPPPRVISSSKDACFLCSAFIGLQQKLCVPRSHGRLYPGWRLPLLEEFNDMQNVLNQHLQQSICASINSKLSTERRILYPDPIESTTFTLPLSVTTSASKGNSAGSLNKGSTSASRGNSLSTSLSLQSSTDSDISELSGNPSIPRHATFSDLPSFDNPVITKGKKFSALIEFNATPLIFRYQSFELHVEYSGEDQQSSGFDDSKYALLTAEWLASEEIHDLQEVEGGYTIDSNLLPTEFEFVLEDPKCFYLRVMESLIRIRIQHVGEGK